MAKHILFMLEPGFYDGEEGPFYCPYAAAVEGMLKYLPEIEKELDIRRIAYPRPRQEVLDLLGEENQGTPVLVLAEGTAVPASAKVSAVTGRAYIDETQAIGEFFGDAFGVMKPH